MYQISNEKFGAFVAELRKEKNLTQKELAEKLFVSDKTVSKWERGLSMPNIALLMPIADALEVTVTELLRGEKVEKSLDIKEVEGLVAGSLDLSVRNSIHRQKRNWILAYLFCFFLSIAEVILLVVSGVTLEEMKENVLLITGLMLFFGGWFCFFAKELLPAYYDSNKINYVSQGFFRMHLPGLSFNNGNWHYICMVMKVWTLSTAVLYPLTAVLVIHFSGMELWYGLQKILVGIVLGVMLAAIYFVGKKYE